MTREQMVAWLTLEGWGPVRAVSARESVGVAVRNEIVYWGCASRCTHRRRKPLLVGEWEPATWGELTPHLTEIYQRIQEK